MKYAVPRCTPLKSVILTCFVLNYSVRIQRFVCFYLFVQPFLLFLWLSARTVFSEILLLKRAEVYDEKDGAQGRCYLGRKYGKSNETRGGDLNEKGRKRKEKGKN
jgi:hypothetical protein